MLVFLLVVISLVMLCLVGHVGFALSGMLHVIAGSGMKIGAFGLLLRYRVHVDLAFGSRWWLGFAFSSVATLHQIDLKKVIAYWLGLPLVA